LLQTGRVTGPDSLSPREAQVWALLNSPLTYPEIGEQLFISPRTVESHVNALRRKLDAPDRRALARIWLERRPPAGLPAELSSFVGRDSELDEIALALAGERLVSVIGPGGAGKTRVAVRAARRWAESGGRCCYADLVPVPAGGRIGPTVAAVCQAAPAADEAVAIAARLGGGPVLLVLDNAEHVLDSAARLAEDLLTRCDGLRILVTSRVRLVLPFERAILIGGLGAGTSGPASQLFVARAARDGLDLDRVDRICVAVGGLPLAIELAVARLGALGLDGLEASLHRQLDVLTGGARVAPRHRSLHETISWSYELLGPRQRHVLAQLSVFAEAFTAAAADEVVGAEASSSVATLCEHSLVQVEHGALGTRYRALEAIREFARRQLSAPDAAALSLRHAQWAVRAGSLAEQLAAADWASAGGPPALAIELWRELVRGYFDAGRLRDAQEAVERVADLSTGQARGAALTDAAAIARCRVRGEEATRLDLLAVDALLSSGDVAAAAEALARVADHAVRFAGMFAAPMPPTEVRGVLDRARTLAGVDAVASAAVCVAEVQTVARSGADRVRRAREAVAQARAAGSVPWVSGALDALCVALVETGHVGEAAELSIERADGLLHAGSDPRVALEIKDALHTGAQVLTGAGRLREAHRFAVRHLQMPFVRTEGDLASEELFAPAALSGSWDEALDCSADYLTAWRRSGSPVAPGRVIGPLAMALIHRLRGDEAGHAVWSEVGAQMRGTPVVPPSGYADVFAAIGLLHLGDAGGAARCVSRPRTGFHGLLFDEWAAAVYFEAQQLGAGGSPGEAPALPANPIAQVIVTRALALRARDSSAVAATGDDFERLGCPYQAQRSMALAQSR
jgi:predicted ATPase/DNA-binding CsgD family transcriptional regulator